MAVAYTNIDDVFSDVGLYLAVTKGTALDLSLFPKVVKNRWTWFVNNWTSLYPGFKKYANGDQYLEATLNDFDSDIKSYQLGSKYNVFNESSKVQAYQPFIETINIKTLRLTTGEQTIVDDSINNVKKFAIENFKAMLKYTRQYMSDLTGNVGLSDPTALKALGLTSTTKQKNATLGSLEYIENIIELNKYIVSFIWSLKQVNDLPPNLISVANQNVDSSSRVRFLDGYTSAKSVPFEMSLEHMAQKYMGDKTLWFSIAQINKLQPPYFDPTGTKYYLITPGSKNSLMIADTEKYNLHVGGKVSVGSFGVKEEIRYIERIIGNSNGTMVLFLSGDQDLTKLQVSQKAFVRVFAPQTVTDTDFLLIPSFAPSLIGKGTTPNSDALRVLDDALLKMGIDVAHDDTSGDILVGSNGNFVLSYGIKNIKQAISNVIHTTKGELGFHPGYGLDLAFGETYFGKSSLVNQITDGVISVIKADPRFTNVSLQDVQVTNTSIAMTILVQIQGLDEAIPLTFIG